MENIQYVFTCYKWTQTINTLSWFNFFARHRFFHLETTSQLCLISHYHFWFQATVNNTIPHNPFFFQIFVLKRNSRLNLNWLTATCLFLVNFASTKLKHHQNSKWAIIFQQSRALEFVCLFHVMQRACWSVSFIVGSDMSKCPTWQRHKEIGQSGSMFGKTSYEKEKSMQYSGFLLHWILQNNLFKLCNNCCPKRNEMLKNYTFFTLMIQQKEIRKQIIIRFFWKNAVFSFYDTKTFFLEKVVKPRFKTMKTDYSSLSINRVFKSMQ